MNSRRLHSITSSARASRVGGTSRPSALAVLRLMTNSNLVDCMTGRSAGFSPLRMRTDVDADLAIHSVSAGAVAHQAAGCRHIHARCRPRGVIWRVASVASWRRRLVKKSGCGSDSSP